MTVATVFTPTIKGTVNITSAVTSANVALSNKLSSKMCRATNIDATNWAYIEIGTVSTVTASIPSGATGGSFPLGPGQTADLGIPSETPVWIASICSAGTPIVCFTPGNVLH
jgi:hypothetical protein